MGFGLFPRSFSSSTAPASIVELLSVCADESSKKIRLTFLLCYDVDCQLQGILA